MKLKLELGAGGWPWFWPGASCLASGAGFFLLSLKTWKVPSSSTLFRFLADAVGFELAFNRWSVLPAFSIS